VFRPPPCEMRIVPPTDTVAPMPPCPSAEGLTSNCTKHDMRTRVTYGIVITMMLIMNLVMVAEGMDPSTPSGAGSGSSGSGMTNTMTIGKVFGHSTKLDKSNFDVWLAGLISALAGLSIGIYKSLEAVFKYLKEHGHLELVTFLIPLLTFVHSVSRC